MRNLNKVHVVRPSYVALCRALSSNVARTSTKLLRCIHHHCQKRCSEHAVSTNRRANICPFTLVALSKRTSIVFESHIAKWSRTQSDALRHECSRLIELDPQEEGT